MNISLYRTIGTASSKPLLEATELESTSPGMRILTFLPWHLSISSFSPEPTNEAVEKAKHPTTAGY
jgi:hypothetical protein